MTGILKLDGVWKAAGWDGNRGRSDYPAVLDPVDARKFAPVRVPGEIHLDLIRSGRIPEPYTGTNILASRWVEESYWIYRREFTAPVAARRHRAWLNFDGLDYAAVVYLNGREIGRHHNSFYPCRFEVTGRLMAGKNLVSVVLESGLFHVSDKPYEGYRVAADQALHKRHWLRKPQSHFAWDWSPRLLNAGITGSVALEWTADPVRIDRLVPLASVTPDLATGKLVARLFVEGLGKKPVRGNLVVEIVEAGTKVNVPVEIRPGLHSIETEIVVRNPRLWWPVGLGAQDRYTVKASLSVAGHVVGESTARVGFRHVRINQDRHPKGGRYFKVEINGKPVFIKGGNFVPADLVTAAIDRARYAALVDRALEANFNCLRVWGGGLYEHDDFYDLCDEHGILVWQEFIYACAKYPADDSGFLQDVRKEAVYQVRRLARHPSLIVWCGNNEMEAANWGWPGYDQGKLNIDHALFHYVLPRMLAEEDPTRYYQPSSPFSPDGLDPGRDDVGDQHPWSIGFTDVDFRKYREMACRFPNEGGIFGPTALPTVRACLERESDRPGDHAWDLHENGIAFWGGRGHRDLETHLWLGKTADKGSLRDYVYRAGLVQGEGLAEYIKNFRRRMFDSASAVFWMYNDCWPAVRSWTIVDYYLRRTPSFHPVRRAFAPRTVVVTREGEKVRVYGVNDGPRFSGRLRYGIMRLSGGYPVDEATPVTLEENASTLLAEYDARAWDRLGVKTHVAFALLADDMGTEVARDRMIIPLFKEMKWPRGQVGVSWTGGKAVFTSRTFAWRVCLDLDGEKRLPDNFFDVWPGVPTVLPWPRNLGRPAVLRTGNR